MPCSREQAILNLRKYITKGKGSRLLIPGFSSPLKGKRLSEEQRINIGLGNLGKSRNVGKIPWNKGIKLGKNPEHSMRMKGRKLSEEALKKFIQRGENHYLYKKDRTQLVRSEKKHLDGRYREWMFGTKKRDNWKCRIINSDCKGHLESHHILNWKDYPELRYDINNGITLCHAHHPRGREKEAELSPYFQKLVIERK